jgi:ribosomal protein S18 acetylase RimI-like enzyme
MNPIIRIEKTIPNPQKTVDRILRALPEWFGIESAIGRYAEEAETSPGLFSFENEEVAGFLTYKIHTSSAAEIYCMAIHPSYHRRGHGAALVQYLDDELKNRGIEYLQVKTLGPSRPSEHYAMTREFYFQMGFRPMEEFDSIWPGNPCLIMVKRVGI